MKELFLVGQLKEEAESEYSSFCKPKMDTNMRTRRPPTTQLNPIRKNVCQAQEGQRPGEVEEREEKDTDEEVEEDDV